MLSLKNVSNRLWDKQILKDISWSTEFGQSWAILGPNGAGKSTLIKVVLGQIPYCGTIERHQEIEDFGKIAHVSLEQQKILVAREEKKHRYREKLVLLKISSATKTTGICDAGLLLKKKNK